ncbi:hypothetical protein RMATCC62417_16115 [Rhizopus microsporus]|nr:hypothetical protein RMATCC62417_16115 [Rhizopus microsporus]
MRTWPLRALSFLIDLDEEWAMFLSSTTPSCLRFWGQWTTTPEEGTGRHEGRISVSLGTQEEGVDWRPSAWSLVSTEGTKGAEGEKGDVSTPAEKDA